MKIEIFNGKFIPGYYGLENCGTDNEYLRLFYTLKQYKKDPTLVYNCSWKLDKFDSLPTNFKTINRKN